MRFVDMGVKGILVWNMHTYPESKITVGSLGRRKVQLSLYRL